MDVLHQLIRENNGKYKVSVAYSRFGCNTAGILLPYDEKEDTFHDDAIDDILDSLWEAKTGWTTLYFKMSKFNAPFYISIAASTIDIINALNAKLSPLAFSHPEDDLPHGMRTEFFDELHIFDDMITLAELYHKNIIDEMVLYTISGLYTKEKHSEFKELLEDMKKIKVNNTWEGDVTLWLGK